MAQPTNNIFLSHQTSQQYFQPWLINQTSPNKRGEFTQLTVETDYTDTCFRLYPSVQTAFTDMCLCT